MGKIVFVKSNRNGQAFDGEVDGKELGGLGDDRGGITEGTCVITVVCTDMFLLVSPKSRSRRCRNEREEKNQGQRRQEPGHVAL
jgi:hypothetical protein